MNWAAEHEIPTAQKVSHQHVSYQAEPKGEEDCDDCKNFIKEPRQPGRCRTVKSPISPEGWCVRFHAIRKEEPE